VPSPPFQTPPATRGGDKEEGDEQGARLDKRKDVVASPHVRGPPGEESPLDFEEVHGGPLRSGGCATPPPRSPLGELLRHEPRPGLDEGVAGGVRPERERRRGLFDFTGGVQGAARGSTDYWEVRLARNFQGTGGAVVDEGFFQKFHDSDSRYLLMVTIMRALLGHFVFFLIILLCIF
jgi:hypothetical protein